MTKLNEYEEPEAFEVLPGQLRALLQPIIFGRLTEDVENTELRAGDWVGMQFWGEGKVLVTRVTDSYQVFRTARQLHTVATAHNIFGAGTTRTKVSAVQLDRNPRSISRS